MLSHQGLLFSALKTLSATIIWDPPLWIFFGIWQSKILSSLKNKNKKNPKQIKNESSNFVFGLLTLTPIKICSTSRTVLFFLFNFTTWTNIGHSVCLFIYLFIHLEEGEFECSYLCIMLECKKKKNNRLPILKANNLNRPLNRSDP